MFEKKIDMGIIVWLIYLHQENYRKEYWHNLDSWAKGSKIQWEKIYRNLLLRIKKKIMESYFLGRRISKEEVLLLDKCFIIFRNWRISLTASTMRDLRCLGSLRLEEGTRKIFWGRWYLWPRKQRLLRGRQEARW